MMKALTLVVLTGLAPLGSAWAAGGYPIVDTGQVRCYDNRSAIEFPKTGEPFFGQDAQYSAHRPSYRDNGDDTVSDRITGLMWTRDPGAKVTYDGATGLTWMKSDSGRGMNWAAALEYAENLELGGHSDWRLPNAKELQSIVDYSRSPDTSGSAAIGPVFHATAIRNEGGKMDFASYWSGTSHRRGRGAEAAVYVAFGRSLGWMGDRRSGKKKLMDVHGAGSQRSDPKAGDASRFPHGRGPQGDVIRIENFVRCVRGGGVVEVTSGPGIERRQPRRQSGRGAERGGEGPRGGGFIERLDKDGNGSVSKDEFDGPTRHFRHLDRNGDGVISKAEEPAGPPPPRRGGQ